METASPVAECAGGAGAGCGCGPLVADEPVKATNDEACECKRAAAALGYWQDRCLPLLGGRRGSVAISRNPPEINRGYYARVQGLRLFIDNFLSVTGNNCQIVNLGCGFDTLYWRLREDMNQAIVNFVEIDFPSVTARKCQAIKKSKALLEKIYAEDGEVIIREGDLHADGYHLLGCDLRCLSEVQRKLERTGIKYDLPTLFISECVLVYLKPEPCQRLLIWLAKQFPNSMLLNYEQVNLKDKFGEVMMSNLSARGCPLAGAEYCTSLETQKQRFLDTGWSIARAWDMETIWKALPQDDRRRVEALEMLDERELLIQLFQHYCIVIAIQGEILSEINLDN